MSTDQATRTSSTLTDLGTRVVGAGLALGVAYVHVVDQGGFPGEKDPRYIGIGYYLLEIGAVVVAVLLLAGPARRRVLAWTLSLSVALGPIAGFVLTRGPGLPNAMDDRGNWTETLGVVSLVVEGALLLVAGAALARSRRTA